MRQVIRDTVRQLIAERDDIGKLPLPAAAKRYARRHGLKSIQRQPRDAYKAYSAIMRQRLGPMRSIDKVGTVQKTFKEAFQLDESQVKLDIICSKETSTLLLDLLKEIQKIGRQRSKRDLRIENWSGKRLFKLTPETAHIDSLIVNGTPITLTH